MTSYSITVEPASYIVNHEQPELSLQGTDPEYAITIEPAAYVFTTGVIELELSL